MTRPSGLLPGGGRARARAAALGLAALAPLAGLGATAAPAPPAARAAAAAGAHAPASAPAAEEELEHYPGGAVKWRCQLDAEGRRNGSYFEYYEDGAKKVRARYRRGVLDGKYESFHPGGGRWITAQYDEGRLDGKHVERRADGETVVTGRYRDGRKDGEFELEVGGRRRRVLVWSEGALASVDGIVPFPKSLETVRATLAALRAGQAEAGGDEARWMEDTEGERTEDTEENVLDRRGALATLQSYRYLCDLPYEDLALSPRFNYHTTIGAKLLEELGQLTHWPKNPGWEKDRFRDAYLGTSSSNLAYTSGGMTRSVHNYMDDSDAMNIAHVGHRVWCLEPALKVTGFGRSGRVSGMWVKDESRSPVPEWNTILYPPPGYLPVEFFGARRAWSVVLNEANHGFPQEKKLDPHVWRVDEDFLPLGEPLALDHLSVDGHTVIFRPEALEVAPGARYWVELEGVRAGKVGSALTWVVEFVAAEAPEGELVEAEAR